MQGKDFLDLCNSLATQQQTASIVLCDDYLPQINDEFLFKGLRKDQHCILFSSIKEEKMTKKKHDSSFDVMHLSVSLRSTCRLAKLADDWVNAAILKDFDFNCKPGHNFEGGTLDITVVEKNESCPCNDETFICQSVNVIQKYANKILGSENLPVVVFLDPETLDCIVKELSTQNYKCRKGYTLEAGKKFGKIEKRRTSVDGEASLG